jgi:large subunit ribosomal protein L9
MKVILLQKVLNLGEIGDIKEVKHGFARNYLIPTGAATYATAQNRKVLDSILEQAKKEDQAKYDEALALTEKIDGQSVCLVRQTAPDGRLFGSVKAHDIAEILGISHRSISIKQPIKYTGSYQISVTLHPKIITNIDLVVASSEADAEQIQTQNKANDLNNEAIN